MKLAVVSPHRGTAACSLGLAIGGWLQEGHAVEVISVFTRSEFAPFSDVDSLHPNDRLSFASAVRKREDEAWAKLYVGQLGRGRLALTDLNLKDAPLRLHCAPGDVRQREPELTEKVSSKITRALQQSAADAWLLPLGVGRHVDHLTVRMAALPDDRENFPLAYYEELPDSAQPEAQIVASVEGAALEATVPLQSSLVPAAVQDMEASVKRKQRLALCYDSQLDDAMILSIAEFSRQYGARERVWGNAAWSQLGLSLGVSVPPAPSS